MHHNGKLVLGESIGDLAGAKIAYRAFQISQRGKPPAPTIDGFTPEQQFFIAWGQFRGDAMRPESQRTMVQGDPHPIGKYPRHRPALEPAGVPAGVLVQARTRRWCGRSRAVRSLVSESLITDHESLIAEP